VKRRNDFGAHCENLKKISSIEQGKSFNERIASPWRVLMLPTSRPRQSYGF
jgi:hypothetical protein